MKGMRRWTTALAALVALLAGCTAATPAPQPAPSAQAPPCGGSLTVRWARATLTATNSHGPCRLGGTAVAVPWWRLDPPTRPIPAAVLGTGDSLVQSYRVTGSNGCPSPGGLNSPSRLTVTVDGHAYDLDMSAYDVHSLTVCLAASPEPPRITHGA
jgi:hypothetical protein